MSLGIEFRNNGLIDSLTQTLAPELFQENLKRDIATSQRGGTPLAIICINLVQSESKEQVPGYYLSLLEESLIKWAFEIESNIRGGEYFSRISESGFWILIRGEQVAADIARERIVSSISGYLPQQIIEFGFAFKSSCVSYQLGESLYNYIQRVDLVHFN